MTNMCTGTMGQAFIEANKIELNTYTGTVPTEAPGSKYARKHPG